MVVLLNIGLLSSRITEAHRPQMIPLTRIRFGGGAPASSTASMIKLLGRHGHIQEQPFSESIIASTPRGAAAALQALNITVTLIEEGRNRTAQIAHWSAEVEGVPEHVDGNDTMM